MRQMNAQHGFTLVELMIALTLGLIIIAAATGIYIANFKTLSTQKSSSEMQSASMFGVQPLEARLRLANLGNEGTSLTDTLENGGIVLSVENLSRDTNNRNSYANLVSRTGITPSNIEGARNDQLTIQFTNSTDFDMFDCEGNTIPSGRKSIERYHVPEGEHALYCDAGQYDADGKVLSGFGDSNGVPLIANVDLFRYRLGVQNFASSTTSYHDATGDNGANGGYKIVSTETNTGEKPPIVSIHFGIITRGSTPITNTEGLSQFTLLGESVDLAEGVSNQFVRNSFETSVLLRNARVTTFNVDNAQQKTIF